MMCRTILHQIWMSGEKEVDIFSFEAGGKEEENVAHGSFLIPDRPRKDRKKKKGGV